ncbi:MAG: sigma factor [Actinomycetota bacterium]|nr:sigma factor [Actinomycetota bacterium]
MATTDDDAPSLSPFDTLEETFRLLCTGPRPLALDGSAVPGLPDREIPLVELRAMLLHPSVDYPVRDAALGALVAAANTEGGRSSIGLAGVMLPGLRRAIFPLFEARPDKLDDLEAEAIVGLLRSLECCRPGRPRVASWLCWRSRIAAARLLRRELAERAGPGADPVSAAPPRPWGHPDFVLAHVVAAGVICEEDADLIATTRLEHQSLEEAARALRISYKACQLRRARAEATLAAHLRSDNYSPLDFVEKRPRTPCSCRRGRPRDASGADRRPGKRRSSPDRGGESAQPGPPA